MSVLEKMPSLVDLQSRIDAIVDDLTGKRIMEGENPLFELEEENELKLLRILHEEDKNKIRRLETSRPSTAKPISTRNSLIISTRPGSAVSNLRLSTAKSRLLTPKTVEQEKETQSFSTKELLIAKISVLEKTVDDLKKNSEALPQLKALHDKCLKLEAENSSLKLDRRKRESMANTVLPIPETQRPQSATTPFSQENLKIYGNLVSRPQTAKLELNEKNPLNERKKIIEISTDCLGISRNTSRRSSPIALQLGTKHSPRANSPRATKLITADEILALQEPQKIRQKVLYLERENIDLLTKLRESEQKVHSLRLQIKSIKSANDYLVQEKSKMEKEQLFYIKGIKMSNN
jgi:hypothetical protein